MNAPWARLQTNRWSCGPCALRHALRMLGVRASVRSIARHAGIDAHGPEDTTPGLAAAALAYGCRMQHVVRNAAPLARIALQNLTPGPVLMCVERWNHWICVTRAGVQHVYYLDSERPGPVERRDNWPEFLARAMKWHRGSERFDLYPVVRT